MGTLELWKSWIRHKQQWREVMRKGDCTQRTAAVCQKHPLRIPSEPGMTGKYLWGRSCVQFIWADHRGRLHQSFSKACKKKLDSCFSFTPLQLSWSWAFISAGHVRTCPALVFHYADRHGFLWKVFEHGYVQGHGQLNPVHMLNAVTYLSDLTMMNKLQRHFPFLHLAMGSRRSASLAGHPMNCTFLSNANYIMRCIFDNQEWKIGFKCTWCFQGRSDSVFQPNNFPLSNSFKPGSHACCS